MDFRTATPQDIPALINMRIAFLMEDHGHITIQEMDIVKQSITLHLNTYLNKNTIAFVAEYNQQIVCTVILVITQRLPRIDSLSGKIGTLKNVYTKPEYRKQGIAKKLVIMAMEEAQKLGLDFLDLEATQQALPIYEKLGFRLHHSHYTPMRWIPQ